MIKTITIENYQSHKNSTIQFSPNLTGIVGLNNHGKSVIFRALKKMVRNTPSGDLFVSDWADTCILTLVTDKTSIVRKVRNISATDSNMYIINSDEEYANFGRDIPEAVLEKFEISRPIIFSDVELDLNFQSQFDTLFLVQGAGLPSIRGKVMSRVTGIDMAQIAMQKVASDEKQIKQAMKHLEMQIETTSEEILKYEGVDELKQRVQALDARIKDVDETSEHKDKLVQYLQKLRKCVQDAKKVTNTIQFLSRDFKTDITNIKETVVGVNLLYMLHNTEIRQRALQAVADLHVVYDFDYISRHQNSLKALLRYKEVTDKLTILREKGNKLTNELEHILYTISYTSELQGARSKLIELKNIEDSSSLTRSTLAISETEYKNVDTDLQNLKVMLKVCPVCGNPFKLEE